MNQRVIHSGFLVLSLLCMSSTSAFATAAPSLSSGTTWQFSNTSAATAATGVEAASGATAGSGTGTAGAASAAAGAGAIGAAVVSGSVGVVAAAPITSVGTAAPISPAVSAEPSNQVSIVFGANNLSSSGNYYTVQKGVVQVAYGSAASISFAAGSKFLLKDNLLTIQVGQFNVVNTSNEPLIILTALRPSFKIVPITVMPNSTGHFEVSQEKSFALTGTATQGSIVVHGQEYGTDLTFMAWDQGVAGIRLANPASVPAYMAQFDESPETDDSTTKDYNENGLPQSVVDSVGGNTGGGGGNVGTPVEATSQSEVGTPSLKYVAYPLDVRESAWTYVDGTEINSYQVGSSESLGRNRRGVGESGSTGTGDVVWTRWLPSTGPSEEYDIIAGQWESSNNGATSSTQLIAGTPVTNRPLNGTADYNLAGGTLPAITGSGATGTLDSGSMRVDFSTNRVGLELGLTAGGSTWGIETPGGIAQTSTNGMLLIDGIGNTGGNLMYGNSASTTNGYMLNVTQDASACGGCDATVRGFIAGNAANSAGVAYQISPSGYSPTLAADSITGTAGFSQ